MTRAFRRLKHKEQHMPAKRGGVITVGEARVIFKDAPAMKTALHFIQFAAGDRVEDKRMRNPNQTDSAKPGWRRVEDAEHEQIREIVGKLVDAIRATEPAS
jgi:hypothetical protein